MLVSKNWLADFVQLDISTDAMCDKLTALGLEVDAQNKAAPMFHGVVLGKVVTLEKHAEADKLRVASVDVGEPDLLQIVCGAPNVAVDMLVPVATVGAVLPGDFHIKEAELRGVTSLGMLCSESELGLAEKAAGLMALPESTLEKHALGKDIRDVLVLDDDIIEIGLTPNRGDCFSMLGVARELATVLGQQLRDYMPSETLSVSGDSPAVHLHSPTACPRYIAQTVSGIDNTRQSPLWLTERLRRLGVRSISPVVDVTNYVMLELGTPMHAFNATAIDGDIHIRMAEKAEKLVLLDDSEITLDSDMLVIADDSKAIALAGIMGGDNSEVDSKTQTIVLESAWFAPEAIIGRGRRLGLHTDASQRFERGVDFSLQKTAIERAVQLIIDICGGQAHQATIAESEDHLPTRKPITLNAEKIDSVIGMDFPKTEVMPILSHLGFAVADASTNESIRYTAIAPNYRFDVSIEEDLIEELARVWGYDKVPVNMPSIEKIVHQPKYDNSAREQLHTLLTGMGYHEAITYSFIDEKSAELLSENERSIALKNPISKELAVMRTSLLPSLAKVLSHNVNRQQHHVRFYEFGHGYQQDSQSPVKQTEKLAGIATGEVLPLQWGYRSRPIDFFDIKGDIEVLVEQLGVSQDISYERSERSYLHPGQSAEILYQGKSIGFVGAVHPAAQKALDIDTRLLAFELDIATIIKPRQLQAQTISKYPEIRRDISVLMAQKHQADDVLSTITSVSGDLVTDVKLFDVYIGRNIPRNTKSMAIAIYLQDKERTLTDEQADQVVQKITDKLSDVFNAELRG